MTSLNNWATVEREGGAEHFSNEPVKHYTTGMPNRISIWVYKQSAHFQVEETCDFSSQVRKNAVGEKENSNKNHPEKC